MLFRSRREPGILRNDSMKITKNLKGNNPGNMRRFASINWQGELPGTEGSISSFKTVEHGYRAMFKDLAVKIGRGVNTISAIIKLWAPFGDGANDPNVYAKHVSEMTGFGLYAPLTVKYEVLAPVVAAMTYQEHGSIVDPSAILKGWNMSNLGPSTSNLLVYGENPGSHWPGFSMSSNGVEVVAQNADLTPPEDNEDDGIASSAKIENPVSSPPLDTQPADMLQQLMQLIYLV